MYSFIKMLLILLSCYFSSQVPLKLNNSGRREGKLIDNRNGNMKCTSKVSFGNWEFFSLLFRKNHRYKKRNDRLNKITVDKKH